MNRNEFINSVETALENVIENKSLWAWFFNDADGDEKNRKEAEETLNSLIPGSWRFVEITGNGTNVGEGWFAEDEYGICVSLASFYEENEEDDDQVIDTFDIWKKENWKSLEKI